MKKTECCCCSADQQQHSIETMKFTKLQIATFLAILFHLSGAIGILCTPYKTWFIQNTSLNLFLMAVLLIWTQPQKKISFFFFFVIAFLVGMGTEMIGVNTGHLFGNYQYGNLMGAKLNGVPYLIGLNWFVVIFGSISIMQSVHEWSRKQFEKSGGELSRTMGIWSFFIDGAAMATFFDWVMEPVAIKLGFWQWKNAEVPMFNYTCWFLISLALLFVYKRFFSSVRPNHFAVHLFIIQLLFFLALRTYL